MKSFIVFSCLLIVAYGISQEVVEEYKAEILKLGGECKDEIGATEDDVAPILNYEPPTSHAGKCLIACLYKKMGFHDQSGKISKAGTEAAIEKIKEKDEELYGKLKTVSEHCLAEVSDAADECETAANMFVCVKKEQAAAGIEPIDFNH